MQNAQPILYRQWLVWQIIINYCINPAKKVKLVKRPDFYSTIKLDIIIKDKKKAIKKTKKDKSGLIF